MLLTKTNSHYKSMKHKSNSKKAPKRKSYSSSFHPKIINVFSLKSRTNHLSQKLNLNILIKLTLTLH